jgi:hypothetical protein
MATRSLGQPSNPALKQYASYGLVGGAAFGLLVGVLAAGPHFHDWPVSQSLTTIVGLVLLGSIVGRLAAAMAVAFMARGAASHEEQTEEGTASALAAREQSAGQDSVEVSSAGEGQ